MVYDDLECIFECLNHPLCMSVNLGAEEKLWCELLPSDKENNTKKYYQKKSSHHYYFEKLPCSSRRCQNRGTCLHTKRNYKLFECLCENGFSGEYCEKVEYSVAYFLSILAPQRLSESGVVTLQIGSVTTSVFCHVGDFGCGDGAWTLVMKIDGSKLTFHYDSNYWSNKEEYNLPGGVTGFDSLETKLPTYWNISFSKICLGMKINEELRFIVIDKIADSLYALIADGQYRSTNLGPYRWKSLIGSQGYLQQHCNKEGFNLVPESAYWKNKACKARIGIFANNQNNCGDVDSRIGFGTGGGGDRNNTCGNDGGPRHIKAMGYILVQ
ncbi:hypothetical protein AWC38_SpisGene18444 [Stylophora pistillata]|uniref:EGF-like domain-containing protein n=2 Tax=Stylophora pistillata TaxID=50429 RepID=A0A2B4RKA3_STYPI|nr:hypothetical protein AWC38_SpisGene18444 [Stylophora pistillata]